VAQLACEPLRCPVWSEHGDKYAGILAALNLLSLVYVSIVWCRDLMRQCVHQGHRTKMSDKVVGTAPKMSDKVAGTAVECLPAACSHSLSQVSVAKQL
jgi:hypothetical protein